MLKFKFSLISIIVFSVLYTGTQAQNTHLVGDVDFTVPPFTYGGVTHTCDGCTLPRATSLQNIADIIKYFNFARRVEESRNNIPVMSLGTLVLPSDFSSYSPQGKSFFVLNEERKCRNLDPLTGIEEGLCIFSAKHAEYLHNNNLLGHNGPNGETFESRRSNIYKGWAPSNEPCYAGLQNSVLENCSGVGWGNEFKGVSAILAYIYLDATSQWGHRDNCLRRGNQFCYGYGESSTRTAMQTGLPLTGGNCGNQIRFLNLTDRVNMSPTYQAPSPPPPPPITQGQDILANNTCMNAWQKKTSVNAQYKFEAEGYFIYLKKNGETVWSQQFNMDLQCLKVKNDGNLVAIASNNQEIWSTGTGGRGNASTYLKVQDDGNLVLYNDANTAIWATGTCGGVLNGCGAVGSR